MAGQRVVDFMHGKFTDKRINIALLVFYSLFTLFVTLRHEPWADELQAWLIARDTTWRELFVAMRYEGHFLPWYLMLRIFATTGCPVLCMNLLSWALCSAAAAVLLFKAPLGHLIKCTILVSAGMLFWFPVVARCYAFIPILIFLLALEYRNRMTHPLRFGLLIALLANTHAYMEGFCGILFLFWAIDWFAVRKGRTGKRILFGLLIAVVGALIAFVQVAPGIFIAESVGCQRYWPTKMSFIERLITPLIDFAGCTGEAAYADAPMLPMIQIVVLACLGVFLWKLRKTKAIILYFGAGAFFVFATVFILPFNRFLTNTALFFDYCFLPFFVIACANVLTLDRRMGIVLIASILWQYFFAVFLFYFLPQRALTIYLVFIFCVWQIIPGLRQDTPSRIFHTRTSSNLVACMLMYGIFTLPGALTLTVLDITNTFSGIRDVGIWLSKNVPEGSTIIIPNYGITQSVISAYLPKHHIMCVESGSEVTYCPLNRISLRQYPKFSDSPNWRPIMDGLPKPHWFVCDARFFGMFPLHHMDFRIGDDHFDEVYRTPRIYFSAVSGEQFWVFTDAQSTPVK